MSDLSQAGRALLPKTACRIAQKKSFTSYNRNLDSFLQVGLWFSMGQSEGGVWEQAREVITTLTHLSPCGGYKQYKTILIKQYNNIICFEGDKVLRYITD